MAPYVSGLDADLTDKNESTQSHGYQMTFFSPSFADITLCFCLVVCLLFLLLLNSISILHIELMGQR